MSEVRQWLLTGPTPVRAGLEARLALAGTAVCAGAVAVAAGSAPKDAAFGRGLLELLIVAVPIATGLYALRAEINSAFGVALLVIGFGWALTALGESSLSVPYTVGRLATWTILPSVIYLLLAFPDGRIAPGPDRVLLWGIVAVIVVLFFGTAPLVTAYPLHTPWATCTTDCPANALTVVDRTPAFFSTVVLIREWLIDMVWVGVAVSMLLRWRSASRLHASAIGLVFVAGALVGAFQIAYYTSRELGASAGAVLTLSWIWTFCIIAVCVAFAVALFRRRMLLADALSRLAVALRFTDDVSGMRDALAVALTDPTLELLFRDRGSGTWHDSDGRPVAWPRELGPDRTATNITGQDGIEEVVLVHDIALQDDQELLGGAGGMVFASRRHERLMGDLAGAMADLDSSRRRLAEAADLERARIERDLHDGAQQQLVALRIRADIAEKMIESDPARAIQEVHKLGLEADRALAELRSLARGVYPSVLTDLGLVEALRAATRQAPLPVYVHAEHVDRLPGAIELAVYFVCIEAVQNAMKHARKATGVWISITQSRSRLRFEVCDDGTGFEPNEHPGRGLRNMRDRLEVIGGDLRIDSGAGQGTRILGTVNLPTHQ